MNNIQKTNNQNYTTPKIYSKAELLIRFKDLTMLCLDVDGTLTSGGMYVAENEVITKQFYAHDGTGIQMLMKLGVVVALVTTSTSVLISNRAEVLGIEHVILGSNKKGEDILSLCKKLSINPKHVAFMGDDVNDLLGFKEVGFPIAVNNASEALNGFYCYKTKNSGGAGAVREICDMILLAKTGKLYGPPYLNLNTFTQ